MVTIEVKPGKREAFLAEFHKNLPNVHAEKGCIEYAPAVDLKTEIKVQIPLRENVVTVVEKWESQESKRLSDSLSQFLTQTRVPTAPDSPVDRRELIGEAVTLLRNSPEVGPEHSVESEADAGPHRCLADRDKIAQVFWNLARNALEAMPGGGRLLVRLVSRGDEVVLAVRDEGRGLAREEQIRIF